MKLFKIIFKKKVVSPNNNSAPENLSKNLNVNIQKVKNEFGNSSDLDINLCNDNDLSYVSIYLDSIVDKSTINSLSSEIAEVLKIKSKSKDFSPEGYFNSFKSTLNGFRKVQEGTDFNTLVDELTSGKTIFLVDGYNKFFSIDTFMLKEDLFQSLHHRMLSEDLRTALLKVLVLISPSSENVLKTNPYGSRTCLWDM